MDRCPHCPAAEGRVCWARRAGAEAFCRKADPGDPTYDPAFLPFLADPPPAATAPKAPPAEPGGEYVPPAFARCIFARPLIDGAVNCRDRVCQLRGVVVCLGSDCSACPVPAGRLLTGPG